jgi:hypothetical protein
MWLSLGMGFYFRRSMVGDEYMTDEPDYDDSKPSWGEGENLTGDAYVKWIRRMRGEEE